MSLATLQNQERWIRKLASERRIAVWHKDPAFGNGRGNKHFRSPGPPSIFRR